MDTSWSSGLSLCGQKAGGEANGRAERSEPAVALQWQRAAGRVSRQQQTAAT
jgi:hypothetical protein